MQMMNAKSGVVVAMMMTAFGLSGCASLPKMSTSMPVEIDTGFGTPRYTQQGHAIDAADMGEQLSHEEEAGKYVGRAQGLRVGSTLLSLAGGTMIGVPLGQKIGGNRKPLWALAGVGGACVALTIPLTIGAVASADSAVKAHNRSLDGPSARVERAAPGVAAGLAMNRSLTEANRSSAGRSRVATSRLVPTTAVVEPEGL